MSSNIPIELTQRECSLVALALDTLLNTLPDGLTKAEVDELFQFFDQHAEPDPEEFQSDHDMMVDTTVTPRIHLIYDKNSNIVPLFPRD